MPGDGPSSMGRRGAMRVGVCSHRLAEDGKWEEWGEVGDIPECRTLLAGLPCPARGGALAWGSLMYGARTRIGWVWVGGACMHGEGK